MSVLFGPPLRLYLAEELFAVDQLLGIDEAERRVVARQLLKRP